MKLNTEDYKTLVAILERTRGSGATMMGTIKQCAYAEGFIDGMEKVLKAMKPEPAMICRKCDHEMIKRESTAWDCPNCGGEDYE